MLEKIWGPSKQQGVIHETFLHNCMRHCRMLQYVEQVAHYMSSIPNSNSQVCSQVEGLTSDTRASDTQGLNAGDRGAAYILVNVLLQRQSPVQFTLHLPSDGDSHKQQHEDHVPRIIHGNGNGNVETYFGPVSTNYTKRSMLSSWGSPFQQMPSWLTITPRVGGGPIGRCAIGGLMHGSHSEVIAGCNAIHKYLGTTRGGTLDLGLNGSRADSNGSTNGSNTGGECQRVRLRKHGP